MDFTFYYAKNFFFGHEMYKGLQRAKTPEEIREGALRFLASKPRLNQSEGLVFS
jgi:hypothetical protein